MFKIRRLSLILVMLGVALMSTQIPARAQSPTGLTVWIANYDTKESYTAVVAPDGTTSAKTPSDINTQITMSPDGKWIALQTPSTETAPETFKYLPVNGQSTDIPVAKGYSVLGPMFTNDGKYLLYTLVQNFADASAHWAIGIVTLEGGKKIEYNEPFLPSSSLGKGLVATPMFFDGKQVMLRAFVPFADGNFGGLFLLPVPNLGTTAAGMYPMPKPTRFFAGTTGINMTLASPDGKKVAYVYGDASNPPAAYVSEGPQFFLNTIALVDVATSKSAIIAKAGKGQALGSAIWSADGQSLLFSGGNYQNTSFLVTPKLYRGTVADGQVTEIGTPLTDAKLQLLDMLVCGDTIFFLAGKTDGPGISLNSAPLANLAAPVASLSAQSIRLLACAPVSTTQG